MTVLELTTEIKAPVERVFNLARSVDLHKQSMTGNREEAVGGVTCGLLGPGDEVTWQATHFGIRQELTSAITVFEFPHYFRDEMTRGPFRRISHDHSFESQNGVTIMHDRFEYVVPFGVLGRLFDKLILRSHMGNLLTNRNSALKAAAESMP
jgi:ligand-binding SRPBCC domain-containing protein